MKNNVFDLVNIKKVEKDSLLKNKLLEFIKNFSWEEVKEHTYRVVKNWEFVDWETPFVALYDNQIVGMATIMKSDYYPLTNIFPWVSTIFVTEDYRGCKISKKLVDFANNYAKQLGFKKSYIPTDIVGFYEKYGYTYIKDIVNYGNEIDRLYVKDLKYC